MSKKMKLMSMLLALLMVAMLVTACGTTKKGTDEVLELTVWNTQGVDYVYKEMAENIPEDWLLEKTGVVVQNIYGNDGGQWDAKLTKLVAGDNLPDIVWCMAGQGPSHFNKFEQLDKLWLLTDDMLKKYAPNIWERTPSYVWDRFRNEDGKIIGIPFENAPENIDAEYTDEEKSTLLNAKVIPTSRIVTNLCIRDDILKQIYPEAKSYDELVAMLDGTDKPIGDEVVDIPITTTEQFIDFMYKIRDLNIVENGKKVYAFGYAGDGNDNWEALCYLGNIMYGGNAHQYTAHWNTETEEMEIPLATDFVKTMAKTQNQMILDNVIDPESLAHTGAQFQAKIFQGRYAICSATRAGSFEVINNQLEESGFDFKYRPLYIDIPAPEGYAPYKVETAFNASFCMLDTLSEEEMIKVLKWADLQYTDEFMQIYNWGRPEDGLYTENGDGTRKFIDESFNKCFVYGDSSALDVINSKGLGNMGNRFFVRPMVYSKWTPDILNKQINYRPTVTSGFKFAENSEYTSNLVNVPPSYAYSSEFGAIEEVVDYWGHREEWEIAIKKAIAAADGEFDAKWDDMLTVLSNVVNVDEMERKMTEVARPLYEELQKAGK